MSALVDLIDEKHDLPVRVRRLPTILPVADVVGDVVESFVTELGCSRRRVTADRIRTVSYKHYTLLGARVRPDFT